MILTARYWHAAEFASHDGVDFPEQWQDRLEALCSQLDVIRGAWGGPLRVVSGYRSPAWNARVGGAEHSQHMEGRAADIQPMVPAASLEAACADLHARILRLHHEGRLVLLGGLGRYPGKWEHVDVRPIIGNRLATWTGAGVGDEVA